MTKQPADPDPEQTVSRPSAAFDPDATVSGPLVAPEPTSPGLAPAEANSPVEPDPEATVQGPALKRPLLEPDPDATVRGPLIRAAEPEGEPKAKAPADRMGAAEPDPDATISQPLPALAKDARAERPASGPARKPAPPGTDADATLTLPVAALQEAEAAIAVPAPGRRRNPFEPKQTRFPVQADLAALGGLNRLIAAANPILGGVPHIRHALRDPDAERLLQTLRRQVEAFERAAEDAGIAAEAVAVANFALSALIDESAAATPWGGHWLKAGLLHSLHGEEWGGEKFFMLLAKMAEQPAANRELLEFFYVCLALGYEGRYRDLENGTRLLEEVRAKTYEIVRQQRPRTDRVLSERWRAADVAARPAADRGAPVLWAVAGVALLALVGHQLTDRTQPAQSPDTQAQPVAQAPRPAPPAAPPAVPATTAPSAPAASAAPSSATPTTPSPPAAPVATPATPPPPAQAVATPAAPSPSVAAVPGEALADLAQRFAVEIKRGSISISVHAGSRRIEVRSDEMFASGSARVSPQVEPLLVRIAEALDRVPGAITVTGHSDSVPIATTRFASNDALSLARAESAARLMADRLSDPRRMKAEGRGASEPIAPNDTAANRAKNRRIVIALEPGK